MGLLTCRPGPRHSQARDDPIPGLLAFISKSRDFRGRIASVRDHIEQRQSGCEIAEVDFDPAGG